MKRTILFTTVALAAFSSAYAGASSTSSRVTTITRVAADLGEECFLEDGFTSGYMVSGGKSGPPYCSATANN
jgi:hypothetical protein